LRRTAGSTAVVRFFTYCAGSKDIYALLPAFFIGEVKIRIARTDLFQEEKLRKTGLNSVNEKKY